MAGCGGASGSGSGSGWRGSKVGASASIENPALRVRQVGPASLAPEIPPAVWNAVEKASSRAGGLAPTAFKVVGRRTATTPVEVHAVPAIWTHRALILSVSSTSNRRAPLRVARTAYKNSPRRLHRSLRASRRRLSGMNSRRSSAASVIPFLAQASRWRKMKVLSGQISAGRPSDGGISQHSVTFVRQVIPFARTMRVDPRRSLPPHHHAVRPGLLPKMKGSRPSSERTGQPPIKSSIFSVRVFGSPFLDLLSSCFPLPVLHLRSLSFLLFVSNFSPSVFTLFHYHPHHPSYLFGPLQPTIYLMVGRVSSSASTTSKKRTIWG